MPAPPVLLCRPAPLARTPWRRRPLSRAGRGGVWLALVVLWALAAAGAAAQSASAVVSDRAVRVGEPFTYTLTLQGGAGDDVRAPIATGALRLVSDQPTLDVTTMVGGQTQRRVAWLYEGTRPGTGRVGGLRVTVGGRRLTVDPVAVTVNGRAPPARAPSGVPGVGSELFVRAEPSRETAVVGQQVVVDYVLYFEPHVQPRQTAPIGTWDAAGFWREELDVPSAYPRTVSLGGRTYEAVTIRRVALFPTRAGTLELSPMEFSVDLLRTDRRIGNDPFAPFFSPFSQRYTEETVTAPAAQVAVRELPPGAPPSFDGAVGQFTLRSSADRHAVAAGEPVEVQVTISGTGNLATLGAPALDVPPNADVYGPEEDREAMRGAAPLRGVKSFTWTLVPQGGDIEVPPAAWSYFDPATGTYQTLRTDPVEVAVRGGTVAGGAVAADGARRLRTDADWQRPAGSTAWLWAVLGGGLALPALAALALLGVRAGRERLAADTPDRRSRRAAAAASSRLAGTAGGADGFREVERAVRAFLADRLGVPPSVRERAALDARLEAAGAPTELRDRVHAVIAACARGQFAPGLASNLAAVRADAEATLGALDSLGRVQRSGFRRFGERLQRRGGGAATS
ncbi:BatD family protein [Rubrivirga sp. S365]|uniref:BatD family protein n=1 Tax=Rubrivirga litoralis TaxID=3075598 RepID=A0ABU3BSY6_9BACT|nr:MULTISPECIES: BatD family protein [unclassified Rubrivirga]MDT0632402.1 BatD family protein [Rubrivirga sp. F394]MDT7855227.1 BatD family protein [Rubrivirga sp. S365]